MTRLSFAPLFSALILLSACGGGSSPSTLGSDVVTTSSGSKAPSLLVFSSDSFTGAAPLPATFRYQAKPLSGGVLRCKFDADDDGSFERDGDCSKEVEVKHTYSAAGTFSAHLLVTDDKGEWSDARISVKVTGGSTMEPNPNPNPNMTNHPPTVTMFALEKPTLEVYTNAIVNYQAADEDGQVLTCKVYAGTLQLKLLANATEVDCRTPYWVSFSSDGPGTYPVRIVVTDTAGASVEKTIQVTFTAASMPPPTNRAPSASWSSQTSGNTGTYSFSVTDPENDAVSCVLDITGPVSKQYTFPSCTSHSQQHTFSTPGSYTVRLKMTDAKGAVGYGPTSTINFN